MAGYDTPHAPLPSSFLKQGSARHADDATGAELGRLPCGRASFDCRVHTVAALHRRRAATTVQALIEVDEVRGAAAGVSAPLGHVCMPVEGPRPRPAGRPREDAPRRPVQWVLHQAECATVTSRDGRGEALHTIRSGRRPVGDAEGLSEGVCDDVLTLLTARSTLTITVQCHGALELWGQIAEHLGLRRSAPIRELIDLRKVLESLRSPTSRPMGRRHRLHARAPAA